MTLTRITMLAPSLLGMAALALAGPAAAQLSLGGSGDTTLNADDVVSDNNVITLTGQVDVRQGDVRILADKMVIYPKPGGRSTSGPNLGAAGGDIDRIVATGEFYYITPEQNVRGDKGVYTASTDSFEITGNVVLVQDDSVVRGNTLIYDLKTERARVIADCKGRKCGRDRRVAILIKNADTSLAPSSTTSGT